jgi:NADH-quinone oxidoreductase subunit M
VMTLTSAGVQGGIFQMLAHGISTGGLFLGVGVLYDRRHTRKLSDFGGLWAKMPVFAACYLVIVLASVGLPGLCGFIGEFLVLLGTFTADKTWTILGPAEYFPAPKAMAIISASAVILSAMYLLNMYQKLMFGPLDKPENRASTVRDIHGIERWVFGIVIALALVLGIWPKPILDRSEKSVDAFLSSYRERLADSRKSPDAPSHMFPLAAPARVAPPPTAPSAMPPSPTPTPPPPMPPPPPPGGGPPGMP